MKALNLDEVLGLKNILSENNAGEIHLHDTCGSQYFSLEHACDRTEDLIQNFVSEKNLKAVFANDKSGFRIEGL